MNCDKFEEQISLYIDNELSDEEKEALELHIAECEQCREQLKAITFMRDIMSKNDKKHIKPPSQMRKKIYFKIYRDLLIMFAGLVIIISIVSISGGLAQMLFFDKIPAGTKVLFGGGMALLLGGLAILLYDVFIDMYKILTRK